MPYGHTPYCSVWEMPYSAISTTASTNMAPSSKQPPMLQKTSTQKRNQKLVDDLVAGETMLRTLFLHIIAGKDSDFFLKVRILWEIIYYQQSPEVLPRSFESCGEQQSPKVLPRSFESCGEQQSPEVSPRSFESCGENRIRTCEPVLPVTRFPGVPLQPLEHLSFFCATKVQIKFESQKLFSHFHSSACIFLVH